jgi:hypothetical protein
LWGLLVDSFELFAMSVAERFVAVDRRQQINAAKDALDLPGMFGPERTGIGDERAPTARVERLGRMRSAVRLRQNAGDKSVESSTSSSRPTAIRFRCMTRATNVVTLAAWISASVRGHSPSVQSLHGGLDNELVGRNRLILRSFVVFSKLKALPLLALFWRDSYLVNVSAIGPWASSCVDAVAQKYDSLAGIRSDRHIENACPGAMEWARGRLNRPEFSGD